MCLSIFEVPERWAIFFSKTKYYQGHIMLHPPASNIGSFITKDTLFPPFTRMGPFCTKMVYHSVENPER
jgi:hypothetical protein